MAKTAEDRDETLDLPPVRVSRTFHAPREIVFNAWSSADHVEALVRADRLHDPRGEGRHARRRSRSRC